MFNHEDLIKAHKDRASALANIVLISFGIVLARLWYLQVYKGKILLNYSLQNRLRREIVEAPRGMVYDRNHQLLVDNIPRFDAVVTPQYLKHKKETLEELAHILEVPNEQIAKTLQKYITLPKYKPIIVKKNISFREVSLIETENSDLLGVNVETFISREYKDKEVGAHLLGYISEISPIQLPKLRKRDNYDYKLGDFIGQFGLEEELDLFLRGTNGHEFVEVDALGRKKRHLQADEIFKAIKNQPSVPGLNVRLTIDQDLQLAAYQGMEGKVGAVTAVDVNSGEILAMVSRPSFNPSFFSRGLTSQYWSSLVKDENNPLRDRSIQEHFSPGSTFKTLVAIAALEEKIIDEKTEVVCNGKFRLGARTFHCWKKHGHGSVNVYKSLKESCDVFYYKIATKLDIDVIARYANMFGLGRPTGILLPREISGLVPDRAWKKKRNGEDWMLGETLSCAIGQSYMLATPLQLTMAYASVANGGKLYRPYLVKDIFSNAGRVIQRFSPEVRSDLHISEKTKKIIRDALFQVVNIPSGTAYNQRGKGIQMAGKTGTSQVVRLSADKIYNKCEDFEYRFRHHGIFVGFAPAHNPKIAVGVVVEHGCHGASAAAPVATAVITTYMKKYWPKLHNDIDQWEHSKGFNVNPRPFGDFILVTKKHSAEGVEELVPTLPTAVQEDKGGEIE